MRTRQRRFLKEEKVHMMSKEKRSLKKGEVRIVIMSRARKLSKEERDRIMKMSRGRRIQREGGEARIVMVIKEKEMMVTEAERARKVGYIS